MKKETVTVTTSKRTEFVEISGRIREFIRKNDLRDGILTVFVPHTTAGVTINESADPDVMNDIEMWFEKSVPGNLNYRHLEGNSPAHIKSLLTGSSVTVGIENGEMLLGTWQGIFFCEYDGPRTRKVILMS